MLVLWLSLVVLPMAIGQNPNAGASIVPDHVVLSWTGNPVTSMTVTWRADVSVAAGVVQYQKRKKGSKSWQEEKAVMREFTADIGTTHIFSSTIIGLSPNTVYSYRVGDGKNWSGVKSFTTAKKKIKSFKFFVASDSQSSLSEAEPYSVWRTTLSNAYQRNPNAKFVMNVGDLVDIGQKGEHWNAWFNASAGVIDTIPEMPTTGNHETYGSSETAQPAYWLAQFTLPQNGPEGLKGQVYSFDYGDAHIVVLQSQAYEMKRYGDILKIQKDWLETDLAVSKAKWKIVLFHKPPYGVMPSRTNDDIKEAFCPIFDIYHVDVVFNGHDHGLARTYSLKGGEKVADPSQGTVYFVDGRSGPKTYSNLSKQPWNDFFYDPQDQPTYLMIEVAGSQLTVNSTLQDGTVVDTYTIQKR
jgi:acid phosphatase type 7